MSKIFIEQATNEHALDIAKKARQEDIIELWASNRTDPLHAMRKGIANSSGKAFTALVGDEAICMFGIADGSLLGNTGIPWLIGSKSLDKHAMAFLRDCRKQFAKLASGYDMLFNYVDARNTKAVLWLKWLGFEMDEPAPYGPDKALFHRFWMR